jgi:hypothetical protein
VNKFNVKVIFLLFFILITGFVLVGKPSVANPSKKQFLSEKAYIDPKGFFKIIPPLGWELREFRDDPRGKVKFICQDAFNTVIQVIGAVSAFSNLDELVDDAKMAAQRLEAKYNANTAIERTSFAGVPAMKFVFSIPGKLKQIQIQFLLGKNHYTLAYGAPPGRYDEFHSIAMMSFETVEPVLKDVAKNEFIKHIVASKLRTSKLLIQNEQTDYALILVNEGLKFDPDNKDLLELKKEIEKK